MSDLLGTPPSLEPVLHELAQLDVGDELARLRPCPPLLGQPLRRVRAVRAAVRIDVAAQLPAHRRRIAAQLAGDRPHAFTGTAQVRDAHPLVLGQEPCRDLPLPRNTDHGRIVQPPTAAAGDCSAVSPTFARPPVDTDDPARLRVTDAPRDQRGVLLTLGGLRRRTRPTPACHRNSSNPWHAIGLPLLVTSVEGQIVREIAGRPARDVFEEHIRQGDTDELDRVRPGGYYSTHAFGLVEPDGSHLIRGVFMDTDGNIRTFAPLPVYSAIQIVACEPDDLLAVSHSIAEESVAGGDAGLVLVFSCVARLDVLQERGPEEAERLQAAAGTVPIFGIYTYGEFARTSSVAGYHNSTVAAVAL